MAIADGKILRPQSSGNPLLHFNFFELATDFMETYKKAFKIARSPEWPRYFLFCHAIELVLKAYLAQHGMSQN